VVGLLAYPLGKQEVYDAMFLPENVVFTFLYSDTTLQMQINKQDELVLSFFKKYSILFDEIHFPPYSPC